MILDDRGTLPRAPACFRSGTAILTDLGERPVECLGAGDRVITASGDPRRVRWIGRRGFSARFVAGNRDAWPILIRAGAFGPGVPTRDLYVSPRHALYIAGVLVPAECLTNGRSILQVPVHEDLLYLHVELDSHDILLAEGTPAESYLDLGTRNMFHGGDGAEEPPRGVHGFARRVTDGADLRAVRVLISAFGGVLYGRQAGELIGHVDVADARHVRGWAWQAEYADEPAVLEIRLDHMVVGTVVADRPRPDVRDSGFGAGQCGFDFAWPGSLALHQPCSVDVRRLSDKAGLAGSPRVIHPPPPRSPKSRVVSIHSLTSRS